MDRLRLDQRHVPDAVPQQPCGQGDTGVAAADDEDAVVGHPSTVRAGSASHPAALTYRVGRAEQSVLDASSLPDVEILANVS
ncbi:hypothetical protein GCM10027194_24630 [Thalassiella azotivora]